MLEWGTMVTSDPNCRYGVYVYDDGKRQDFSAYSTNWIELDGPDGPERAQGLREAAATMRRALPTSFHLPDLTEKQYLAVTSLLLRSIVDGRRVTEGDLRCLLSRDN